MEFFMLDIADRTTAEKRYAEIKDVVEQQHCRKLTARRIYRLRWYHDSKDWEATVGKRVPHELSPAPDDRVLAIFESADGQLYFVATMYRLTVEAAVMVGTDEVREVEWFSDFGTFA